MNEAGGLYQPVYAVQGLEGAVYEITAAEDIYTLDGTLRASKGEVVDTVLPRVRTVRQRARNFISVNTRSRKSQLRMEWC